MVDTLVSDTVDSINDPFGVNIGVNGDIAPTRCVDCGNGFEIPAGQRGRKPTKCPECRSAKAGTKSKSDEKTVNLVAEKLEKTVNTMAGTVAMMLVFVSPSDAQIVLKRTPALAKALGTWGSQNDRVKKVINKTADSTAALAVIGAALTLIIEILANHGVVPGPKKKPQAARPNPDTGGVVFPFHSAEGV